jgi:hypothetical protein
MSRATILSLLFVGLVVSAVAYFAMAGQPFRGPFKVTLQLSHMPQLDEEVALVCSVTSESDVNSALVAFSIEDTVNVKIISGQKKWHGKFKKNETKEFRLTVSFQDEGTFQIWAGAQMIAPILGMPDLKGLTVRTYKNKPAELLVRKPSPKPPPAWIINARINARLDSSKAVYEMESRKKTQD